MLFNLQFKCYFELDLVLNKGNNRIKNCNSNFVKIKINYKTLKTLIKL